MVHKYLLYVDIILDQVWEDSRKAYVTGEMNASWRSPIMDRWLTVEYHIQRHTPLDIEVFEEEESSNKDLLNNDPFNLGNYYMLILSHSYAKRYLN
jgi:hypothetical protein